MRMKSVVPVLIPVYNPPDLFTDYFRAFRAGFTGPIIVVNDGSHRRFTALFQEIGTLPDTTVLVHRKNKGKGAALKTAMRHVLNHVPGAPGSITVDADGQHTLADVLKLQKAALDMPQCLLVGSRRERARMPAKSRFGNALTRVTLRLLHGYRVFDTQSGLRYVPKQLMTDCIQSVFDKYDFELDMLVRAGKARIAVSEIPIETIYINKNASSHYKTLHDSAYVARVFWHHLTRPKIVQAR